MTTAVKQAWVEVCRTDEVPVLGARVIQCPNGQDIAIFRNANSEFFALLDECPHKKGPLSQGIVHGRSVTCPLHNWQIGLSDGCAQAPDEGCTTPFSLQISEDGAVYLDASEIAKL